MREEEQDDNDLANRLREHFRVEDRELGPPPGLWDRLSHRLGDQRRPGWRQRVRAISLLNTIGQSGERRVLAASLVLVLSIGLVYGVIILAPFGDGGQDGPQLVLAPTATVVPTVAVPTDTPVPTATTAPANTVPAPMSEESLEISVDGDVLAFNTSNFEVAAGAEVTLVFDNVSTINQHNWVLVTPGTKDDVAGRGTGAGPDNDWVQPGDPDVIAHTLLLDPGTSGEVRFTAPAAGTYQFVCTFPGHNLTMFGDFVVTP